MTKEQYEIAKQKLATDYEDAKNKLITQYCLANNPHKLGDVITDNVGSIRITAIGIYMSYSDPCCFYKGIQLKKDGSNSKRQEHTKIYQSNINKK